MKYEGRRMKDESEGVGWVLVRTRMANLQSLIPNPSRGISLLEVLIAMSIIVIGLFGIAALIPTGQVTVVEAAKADRSSACGRAGMAEVKTRQFTLLQSLTPVKYKRCTMLDRDTWCWANGTSASDAAMYGDALIIDPLFIASNLANPPAALSNPLQLSVFSYGLADGSVPWGLAYLARISLGQYCPANNANGILQASVAKHIFGWADDRIFEVARGSDVDRTRSTYVWADIAGKTETASYPVSSSETPPSGSRLYQANEGNYSWLVTLSPAATEINPSTGLFSGRKYRVSVVVFFRRDMTYEPVDLSNPPKADAMPNERMGNVLLTSGGYGGGDALIYLPRDGGNTLGFSDNDKARYGAWLDVKKDEYILLMGLKQDTRLKNRLGSLQNLRRVAQWYQVVAVDDEVQSQVDDPSTELNNLGVNDGYYRRITLAGPDWDSNVWNPLVGSTTQMTAAAMLVDNVIAVFTKTIELDESGVWD